MRLPERPRAVITGAGSGLGRALCLALAPRRARIVVSDLNEAAARETARQVEQHGGEAHVVLCDVTKPEQVDALARETQAAFGGVDLVVNNAGILSAGEVGTLPLADWKRVLDVNLWGVIHGCHSFVPLLRAQGTGHILNIASAAGLLSSPYLAAYNVSKAGVVALSETLLAEVKSVGLGVTVACPTFFRTNIAASAQISEAGDGQRLKALASMMVDKASVSAEQVAHACLRAVEQDRLYVLPMADGRWAWRLKRLSPGLFARGTLRLRELILARLEKEP
ncbi:short-subunit dehydrogenase [Archangium gephyra]|uniref:Oxidoreductase, short chain dehydrogenase/reductase family n=1 Tax=Archangium gephyra TaxID=48 RepID=A0AAC8TAR5_9BACT|nr:SDR family NAD(P)-dependent oxidoreductase [Archangium gephyra]AKI99146.1 Oxidoreductase, short chain dehydrogenase/reductase family [Archangium gephyra]REG31053.1 short-subunit dehydrogenase [Archangium gephyra]